MAARLPQGGALVPIVPDQDPFKPRWTARGAPPQRDPSVPLPGRTVTRSATAPRVGRAAQPVYVTVNVAERPDTSVQAARAFGNRLRDAARYIGREGEGKSAPFDRTGTVKDTQQAVDAWKRDGRFYTISLNPKDGNRVRDFRAYITAVMDRVETAVLTDKERSAGMRLEWIGQVHNNTGRQHGHILLRGRAGDADLKLDLGQQNRGLRTLAREVASEERFLGPVDWRELDRASRDMQRHQVRSRDGGLEL